MTRPLHKSTSCQSRWLKIPSCAEPLLPHEAPSVQCLERAAQHSPVRVLPSLCSTTGALGMLTTDVPSRKTFNEVLHLPDTEVRTPASTRRTGAKHIGNWQGPDIAVAPFPECSPHLAVERQVENLSPGVRLARSHSDENDVGDEEDVDVLDMSHRKNQRVRRRRSEKGESRSRWNMACHRAGRSSRRRGGFCVAHLKVDGSAKSSELGSSQASHQWKRRRLCSQADSSQNDTRGVTVE